MYSDSPVRPAASGRIELVDAARGIALVAMAVYHFTWDLGFFGYIDPGTAAQGGWKWFARGIAASFLVLVGISLVLAHRHGVRWPGFLKRLAMVAGAAAAISAATWYFTPQAFIFFGILHQIAMASVLGLVFLRLPVAVVIACAAALIAAPLFLRSPFFDQPGLAWVGLSSVDPRSNDYVPLFPWFGAVLAGIAVGQVAVARGWKARIAAAGAPEWTRPLRFAGRHSLVVYLAHQPILIVSLWLYSQVFPAVTEIPYVSARTACEARCAQDRTQEFCSVYCVCVLDTLEAEGQFERFTAGDADPALTRRLEQIAGMCTIEVDSRLSTGAAQ